MREIKNTCLLLAVAGITILSSCQKEIFFDEGEEPNDNRTITGDWTFAGMAGSMQSTVNSTVNGLPATGVATVNYLSKNNSGTATFTTDEFSYSNITYDIDTTGSVKLYVGGFLVTEMEQPVAFNYPPASKTVDYTLNSNDSLTFSSIPVDPTIPSIPGLPPLPQPALPAGPFGARIGWSGDTLLVKTKLTFSQTITQPQVMTAEIVLNSTIKFIRP